MTEQEIKAALKAEGERYRAKVAELRAQLPAKPKKPTDKVQVWWVEDDEYTCNNPELYTGTRCMEDLRDGDGMYLTKEDAIEVWHLLWKGNIAVRRVELERSSGTPR